MNLQTRRMFIGILLVVFGYVFAMDFAYLNPKDIKVLDLTLQIFKLLLGIYWVYLGSTLVIKSLKE